ncbi:hypothetical protein BASA61_003435 [Batrachochytrium salamandrivorans]|nr:hypothetical protein BASA61_003435 [Batrachochytrium salamandrivorans]
MYELQSMERRTSIWLLQRNHWIAFQFVDDSLGSSTPPKVRVVMITDNPEILGLIGNVLSTVAIGDELLTVNGLSFNEHYLSAKALERKPGVVHSHVPYVALSNDECWSLSSSLYEELNSIPPPEIPAPTSFKQKRSVSGNDTSLLGDSTSQRVDTNIHKRSYWESVQFKDTKLMTWPGLSGKMEEGIWVSAADGIIQLFKSDATASQFRYLKNDATKSLFYKGLSSNNPWSKAWDATSDTSRYSGFGSMEDSSIFEYLWTSVFQSYPFKEKLTGENSGQTFYTKITVGVRQLVRSGNYAGQLIEDNGVKSDVIVRPTIDDILLGDRGVSVYDRIANYLGDVAKRKSFIKVKNLESGKESPALSQTDVITVKTPKGLQDHLITFIGTKRGKQVFKTHRQITRMPTSNDRVSMMTAKSYTVLGPSSGVGVYNFGSMSEQEGWNFNDGKWIIGDGVSDYSGYMSSTIRVWLSAPVVKRLQRIVHSWGHGLTVMQFSGSQITRLSTVHGRRHSSIDHFVCNAPARALLTSPRVDRQTAVADHFVIRTSIRAEAQGQPPVPRAPTISRHHCLEATDRIATSNYWDVLADGASDDTDTDTDIHQLTSQFLESANAVADNLSLRLSPPATRSNRRLLSGTTKRAILASNTARQAFIAAATHTNPDPVQCNTLRDEWSRLKAAATQLERVDGRKQWVKHADNLDRAVSDGRTDLVFAAARAMSGNSSRSAAVTPLYNSDGIVQYDPTSILRVMQGHYGSLAADTTGHSLDLQYWHDPLLQMSPRKAPGDDGITTAFYQAALYMPANTQEGVPPTPFARALLRVCGQVFASATIPRAWLCASIVSIDKKDGDPLNPGDKRGIALINVGLKLVCKVLQMRIERFVETNNLLSYEQAGFRKREECVGQVVSLVDIIQRRQNAGLNTHVLFIDIRKAFDTVPSWCTVMEAAEHGIPSSYSCLSQGIVHILICSSSGRITTIGPIPVPGLPRDTNPIRGLMYADDVAVFADSEQSLLAASTAIEQWANRGGG